MAVDGSMVGTSSIGDSETIGSSEMISIGASDEETMGVVSTGLSIGATGTVSSMGGGVGIKSVELMGSSDVSTVTSA